MSGVIHPLPQYAFMAWGLVKAQGQLYLYLNLHSSIRVRDQILQPYKTTGKIVCLYVALNEKIKYFLTL
jgi:hypothetical protein